LYTALEVAVLALHLLWYGRRNWLPQLILHEEDQARPGRQLADVTVQVQTVETLHFKSDMAVEQFRDGCHPTNSMRGLLLHTVYTSLFPPMPKP
jgi:hypothetical protein